MLALGSDSLIVQLPLDEGINCFELSQHVFEMGLNNNWYSVGTER